MTSSYVVDGRFLTARPTGLHRVARQFVTAARATGVDLAVLAPGACTDPLVDRTVHVPSGRVAGRLWEQVVLPVVAGRRPIWSLTNTAPLLRPGVVVIHDLAPLVGPEWFAGSMRWYARTALASARRARRVITVSSAVRDQLVDAGVDRGRISVVSPVVDERFTPATAHAVEAAREKFDLHRDFAVMTGWRDPRKDAATAIAAHLRVAQERPHDLVLLGTPHPTFAPVRVPDAPSIRILGHVGDGELVALLTGARVLLYPSRYEGFGLPPLEALACGTAAVASDIPAIRESSAGLVELVAPGDVEGWARALSDALAGTLSYATPVPGSRAEVGRQLADALSAATGG